MKVWENYLFIQLAFLGLFLSCDCAEIPSCQLNCLNGRLASRWVIAGTPVTNIVTKCDLATSNRSRDECLLNIRGLISTLTSPTQQNHLEIRCTEPTRLVLCDRSCSVIGKNDIWRLKFRGPCKLSFIEVEKLGIVADFKVLDISDGVTLAGQGSNIQSMKGAWNVSAVLFENQPIQDGFPKVFTQAVWTSMAQLLLKNVSLDDIPVQTLRKTMPNLQFLDVRHNRLIKPPQFPWSTTVLRLPRNLERRKSRAQIQTDIYLRLLLLDYNNITDLSSHSFTGLFPVFSLKGNGLRVVGSTSFTNLYGIRVLVLSQNYLRNLPVGVFRGLQSLLELHLDQNNIEHISTETFTDLENLEFLNLRHNHLREVPVWTLLSKSLTLIELQNNNITFPNFINILDSFNWERVNTKRHFQNLLVLSEDSVHPGKKKRLSLKNNKLDKLEIEGLDETTLSKFHGVLQVHKVDLGENPLICDCKLYETQRWLLERIKENDGIDESDFDTWRCAEPSYINGTLLIDVKEELFMCQVHLPKCPRNCTCYVRAVDEVIYVDCRSLNLTIIPEELPRGLLELHFEDNQIGALPSLAFLENVTGLYLSDNNIQELDEWTVLRLKQVRRLHFDNNKLIKLPRAIQKIPFIELDIQNNPFQCNCRAKWMKYWLRNSTNRIVDVKNIRCNTSIAQRKPVIKVEDGDFGCVEKPGETSRFYEKTIFKTVAYILVALLVLTIVMSALIYKFRGEVKVFMFTHFDWHPFDRLDDSDSTKLYDAFVSYSGNDHTWVWSTLAEKLETRDPPYKLCIHDRDFEVGAPIAENIMNSVEQSKRTIMVLSRNFMASEWCLLEFRAAHRRVLEKRMRYLIVILLEDLDIDELDSEIQLYMRTNTYLSVDDEWFWQKLFYAMPRKGKTEKELDDPSEIAIGPCDGEKCNSAEESLETGIDNASCTVEQETGN